MEKFVRLVQLSDLFIPEFFPLEEGLPWRPAAAHLALMCSFFVVVGQPIIQILLQLLETFIEFPAKRNLIEFMQDSFMETFTDAVRLRMSCFGFSVLYAIDAQIEFS